MANSWDKGRLRSIFSYTHTVDISRLQGRRPVSDPHGEAATDTPSGDQHGHGHAHQHHSSNHYQPGSPSKSALNQAHLLLAADGVGRQRRRFLGPLDREVLASTLLCCGASMSDPLMSMVDTYYSGKLGTTALAALGSNGALFSVMYFLCFTALAVLCTQAMAAANSRGDAEGCGRGFIQALAATGVVAMGLVALLLLAPEAILGFFQTNAEVMPYAKTYCMIRALSLPAALSMNICQAAFRSMLDLTTPFAVVMTANASNFLLDQLLMFKLGWGMAGCGWASVISQYIGALLFACIIFRRRHRFGIPEALAGAADRYAQAQEAAAAAADAWSSSSKDSSSRQQGWWCSRWWQLQQQRHKHHHHHQQHHAKGSESPAACGLAERKVSGSYRINVVGSPPQRAAAGREPSGSLRINMPSMQHSNGAHHSSKNAAVVPARGAAGLLHRSSPIPDSECGDDVLCSGGAAAGSSRVTRRPSSASAGDSRRESMDGEGFVAYHSSSSLSHAAAAAAAAAAAHQQAHNSSSSLGTRGPSLSGLATFWGGIFSPRAAAAAVAAPEQAQEAAAPAAAKVRKKKGTASFSPLMLDSGAQHLGSSTYHSVNEDCSSDALAAAAADGGASLSIAAASAVGADGSSTNPLRRLTSVGSDSKLPRLPLASSTRQRLLLLLLTLDWGSFVRRFLGMTVRGLLILSTYSSASIVAAKTGTAMLAAHQVVQQQQQLQMSFAWSFLHVGQSMTANLYHAAPPGGGPRAARRLAQRIIAWAAGGCAVLALATYSNRHALSGIFTSDTAVRSLVSSAALPAALMLGMAWNNALEGCLLAADEQAYVVKVYPAAVAAALTQLGHAALTGAGLPGVWWGLAAYYLVLLLGFAGRFWVYRGRL